MILYIYRAPGQGQTAPRRNSLGVKRNILSLHSFIASFKEISLNSDYIQFFHDLIMYIAPGQGQTDPRGQGQTAPRGRNFDVNRKALSLYPFVASFKEISLKSAFIHFFHVLIHVYSPGEGSIQPPGDKDFMSTDSEKSIVLPFSQTKA